MESLVQRYGKLAGNGNAVDGRRLLSNRERLLSIFGRDLNDVEQAEPFREAAESRVTRSNRAQTNTPAFRKWFGDSKVVDASGEPLVMYHGSPDATFNEFNPESYFTADKKVAEIYTSTSASSIASKAKMGEKPDVYEVYLKIERPFDTRIPSVRKDFRDNYFMKWGTGTDLQSSGLPDWNDGRDIAEWIQEEGKDYDGILLDEGGLPQADGSVKSRGISYIPLKSTQIKSATGNIGTFDPEDADIRRSQRAYHGTPHRGIDKFSTDKIGTGEGAQAFGYGLYFADLRELAEVYRRKLTTPDGRPTTSADESIQLKIGNLQREIDRLKKDDSPTSASMIRAYEKRIEELDKAGQLYEVSIPDDDEMLLWDKPLSQQPKNVKDALNRIFSVTRDKILAKDIGYNDPTGSLIYNRLTELMSGGKRNDVFSNAASAGQKEASMELADVGIKGIKYLDGTSRDSAGSSYNYVIFSGDDVAIEQAFYSRRANKRQKLSTLGQTYDLPATGRIDAARIKLQDDALRMKRVIEAVKDKGGKVGEAQNFYDANTLMPGRIQSAIDDFKETVIRPMIDKAVEYGIDMDELSMYAYAKHAKERNIYIASINPRLPDGGSGMTDAEADAVIDAVAKEGKTAEYEELHQMLMGITSATRQTMLSEGLITPEEFETLEGAYDNYIPLRGFENVVEETGVARPGVGRGVNVRGAETVRAMGRKSKAGDLIENVIRDYERVISRVEKNDVGKVLLDFVLSNPDPDLWGVDVEKTKPTFNKAQGTVQYTKSIEKGEDTIGVKVGGQQVYIKLADKELTRALRQAWKDETSGLERATLAMTGWWNNWLRAVLTKYNPAFAVINIPRDALWSGTASALAELGPKGLASYLAAYPKAFMASARREAGLAGSSNRLFGNPQMDARFAEFRNAGGITGGFFMRTLDDINQELRNDLLMAGASARNPWEQFKKLPPFKLAKMTLKMLEFMGSASENATRFALYQASREQGNSPAKAGLLAKDGTTNFNRKGEWGGALNNLYLFYNAAVQGNAQLFRVLKSPAVQASMAGVAGVGMMLALYGASSGGEDESGEAYWDLIPSYIKERNMVIMLPPGDALAGGIERVGKRGRYLTIPVQYGFNIFPNMGYVMADVLRNAEDPKRGMTPTKAALHMTSVLFGSVNPFGGAVDFSDGVQVLLAAMPTLIDLPIQLVNERGTFGSPSAPSKSPWDVRPDSERMFTSQEGTMSAKIAQTINELGGGNEGKGGKILGMDVSVTPGTIQTLISSTTGGLGTFVEQVGSSVLAMTDSEGPPPKAAKIPFLNKFYGEVDEAAGIRTANDRMREVKKLADEVKAQQKLGLDPEVTDEETKLLDLAGMQASYQKMQTQLRKAELEIIKDEKMTDAQKKLERQRLQVERDKLATEVNREYLKTAK